MSIFGGLLDNMAQNALGTSLLGGALPNSQPQGGLLGASPQQPTQQSQQFQPTPEQRQQMRQQFLGNIGAALQTGQPIQSGVNAYQQNMVAQLQAGHAQQMQQRSQQLMGQFSQEMQAAGSDQQKQAQIIAKYAPYLPAQDLRGMASLIRTETPKPVGIKQMIEGRDPQTGQPAMFAVMEDSTLKQLQGITPKANLVADGQGNIYDKDTGKIEIPSMDRAAFDAAMKANGGDAVKALEAVKGAGKQDHAPTFSPQALAVRSTGGQTGIQQIDAMDPKQAAAALEKSKERPPTVNVAASGPGGQEFMGQLAQRVASGDMSLEQLGQIFPSRGQAGSAQRSQVVQMAIHLNPKLDLTANTANFKNLTNNQTVSSLKYIGNLEANLNTLQQMIPTLQAGDWQGFNKLKYKLGGEFSNTNITNFNALHSVLVNEAARALSGSGAITNEARDMADKIIPQFGSADSMLGAMNTLRGELVNRKSTLAGKIDFNDLRQQTPPQSAPQVGQYRQTATGPGGHKIGSNDGSTWFDLKTGQKL